LAFVAPSSTFSTTLFPNFKKVPNILLLGHTVERKRRTHTHAHTRTKERKKGKGGRKREFLSSKQRVSSNGTEKKKGENGEKKQENL
jgi:hypothetical protein